jgi:hypothetical protein
MDFLESNEALQSTLREGGTGLLETKVRFAMAQVALTFVTSALPTALVCVLLYRLLARFTARPWPRIASVLGYGLLTPVLAYAGAFYGHQLSAACLLAAFYLLFMETETLSTRALLAVGLLLGYSVVSEYPSVLIVGVLFVYAWQRLQDRQRIAWVMLAGGVVAVGWMIYNNAIFGSPLSLGYSHSELWTEQHESGFMSLTRPHWDALWGITFGLFRGLFVLSPLLLLTWPGFALWRRAGAYRREWWAALASVLAMFLFNSSSIMWWGGFAVGPRYLLPALPFMALPLVYVWRELQGRAWLKALTALALAWSLVATWGLTLAGQAFPSDTIRNPLADYAWPNWQATDIARNLGMFLHLPGFASLLPLLAGVGALLAGLYFISRQYTVSTDETSVP